MSHITRRGLLAGAGALAIPKKAKARFASFQTFKPVSGLPAGVSLQAIDGETMTTATSMTNNYYSRSGYSFAANGSYDATYPQGWDSLNFFPVGIWIPEIFSQTDADIYANLNMNTAFVPNPSFPATTLALFNTNKIWAVMNAQWPTLVTLGDESVGFLTADEQLDDAYDMVNTTNTSIINNRFLWAQCNHGQLEAPCDVNGIHYSHQSMQQVMSLAIPTTPSGSRHFDIFSADLYWYNGGLEFGLPGDNVPTQGGNIYGLGRDMTQDECTRACFYGDMVDFPRLATCFVTWTFPAPIFQFVENGEPGVAGNDTTYIQPPQMQAACWSSIIHGARALIYFNHTFCGTHQSNNNFWQAFYQTIQPGQTISIFDQAAATNKLIRALARILNSPFAIDYASVSPAGWKYGEQAYTTGTAAFSGFDVMCKWYNGTSYTDTPTGITFDPGFYIFAQPRYSETLANQTATFTIKNTGSTQVTVINESRTISVTGGTTFSDTFATDKTIHIYKVN